MMALAGRVASLAAMLISAWGAAPPGAPSPNGRGSDLLAATRTMSRVTACSPDGEVPARFDSRSVASHCAMLASLTDQWSRRWLARARPFFDQVVPAAESPVRVVYPFGGGDLLTALVVFPGAAEITTLSLEPAGDPRALQELDPSELPAALLEVRKKVNHIFTIGHSKTVDMRRNIKGAKSKLPGDLTYALAALATNNLEITSVRYFRLDPAGTPTYLGPTELAAASGASGSGATSSPFDNVEIEFRARGGVGHPTRVFRHIAVNLDNAHLEAQPSVLRHLEAKGRISAMTKAASYLLWWKEFSAIRGYLLGQMDWMVSDSTGVPNDLASAAGFEQIPFGRFEGPFLGRQNRPTELFRKLWTESAAPLTFRFGYPDSAGNDHLLITRRATQK